MQFVAEQTLRGVCVCEMQHLIHTCHAALTLSWWWEMDLRWPQLLHTALPGTCQYISPFAYVE